MGGESGAAMADAEVTRPPLVGYGPMTMCVPRGGRTGAGPGGGHPLGVCEQRQGAGASAAVGCVVACASTQAPGLTLSHNVGSPSLLHKYSLTEQCSSYL